MRKMKRSALIFILFSVIGGVIAMEKLAALVFIALLCVLLPASLLAQKGDILGVVLQTC